MLLLVKLEISEKISKLAAVVFLGLIIAMLCFFILLFVSIIGGYFFGELTGSLYIGFGIIAAMYGLLLIIAIRYRKTLIEKRIIGSVIKVLFEKRNAEAENE